MVIILCGIALFVVVISFTIIALTIHNAAQADKLAELNTRKYAVTMLAHAQEYLTQFGSGRNMEYTNARTIIETAMYNVLYQ